MNWTVWSSGVPDAMDNKKCVVLRMDDETYHTEDCDATHSTLCQGNVSDTKRLVPPPGYV